MSNGSNMSKNWGHAGNVSDDVSVGSGSDGKGVGVGGQGNGDGVGNGVGTGDVCDDGDSSEQYQPESLTSPGTGNRCLLVDSQTLGLGDSCSRLTGEPSVNDRDGGASVNKARNGRERGRGKH